MPLRLFPSLPSSLAEHSPTVREFRLRYDDINQQGWLCAMALPEALGQVFWRGKVRELGLFDALEAQGIVAILTRLSLAPGDGPVSIYNAVRGECRHRIAACRTAAGDIDRLVMDVWIDLFAPRDRLYGEQHDQASICCGRVHAEHVFTRLFAPLAERKVTCFEVDGFEPVPSEERPWRAPRHLLDVPGGTDGPLTAMPETIVFGVDHTDENQHVNSLVYPRLFEDAALKCLAQRGEDTRVRAVLLDATFRKPLFAGDRVALRMATFRVGEQRGVVGCFVPADQRVLEGEEVVQRAYAYGRVLFSSPGN